MPSEHVVKLIDVFDDAKCVHIIQELCEGGELFYQIQKQAHFSERDAAAIVKQVASALFHLHAADIVHRDVKPENLLYSNTGANALLKISDFGLSHITGQKDPMVGLFGTMDYIAPEVLRERHFVKAGDMWSLGVILYILLSGTAPFRGNSVKEKYTRILTNTYALTGGLWDAVSESAKDLVRKLMHNDPGQRLTAAEVLRHAWVADEKVAPDLHSPLLKQALATFNAKRRFRVAAFACIAGSVRGVRKFLRQAFGPVLHQFSEKELTRIKDEFYKASGTSNSVDYDKFGTVLDTLGLDLKETAVKRLFELFDRNGDGQVNFRELIAGLACLSPNSKASESEGAGLERPSTAKIKFCFDLYDVDEDGVITREELGSMLEAMSAESVEEAIDQADMVAELFSKIDVNGDGHITFEEFRTAVESDSNLLRTLLT